MSVTRYQSWLRGDRGALEELTDELALDDLQRRRAWEVVEHLDRLRPHVLRHAMRPEELLQLFERRRDLARLGDDRRARALTQPLVGQRQHRHLAHGWVAEDDRLDLGG